MLLYMYIIIIQIYPKHSNLYFLLLKVQSWMEEIYVRYA